PADSVVVASTAADQAPSAPPLSPIHYGFVATMDREISIQGSDVAGFDKSKVECFNCHKMGHFARECRAPRGQERGKKDNYRQGSKTEENTPKALMAIDKVRWDWSYLANEGEDHALVADAEAPTEFALMANTESKVFNNSLCSNDCKKNNDSLNSKIKDLTDELFEANNYIYHYKLAVAQLEGRLVEYKEREVKYIEKIRTLEMYRESNLKCIETLGKELETLKLEKDGVDGKLAGLLKASKNLDNLIKSQRSDKVKDGVGYNAVPPPATDLYLSPKKDLSRTGLPEFVDDIVIDYSRPMPTIKSPEFVLKKKACFNCGNFSHLTNECRKRVQRETTRSQNYAYMSPSHRSAGHRPHGAPMRPLHRSAGHRPHRASMRTSHRPAGHRPHGPSMNPMRPNINGGCKITCKRTIKTGKLEFENVYFVKHLKYNLFSVSQICDKKNSVLFTDSECIMLGRNFKLLDDANILLRTPRQHNMYSIDLNNIVPHKDLTCLVAKASADECILWHRRLGHLNVKTINKLVRQNLVRGLPTKSFDNDHTCTACLKGKQHKASCKSKLVNSVTKPYTLCIWIYLALLLTKDKSSDILRKFITEIKNLKDLKVKIIRVLVNKSQNKIPYDLFNGRTPAIGFLKPFGYHVMILNTLENLGKFKAKGDEVDAGTEAKGDEGYFIGYSMSSKAFMVFNKRTIRVEENLHVEFIENKAIEQGFGPNWLFDIDSLTKSMNYVPVDAGTNSTNLSGTKDAANQEVKKDESSLRYIVLPNWAHDALLESTSSKLYEESSTQVPEGSGNSNPTASAFNPPAEQMETLTVESPIPTVSSPVPTACLNDSSEPSSKARLVSKRVANQEETPSLDNILSLTNRFKDILRVSTSSDEIIGVDADVSNMETSISASPTPTLRIHKDHPK
nr:hypothetical protein [Tanacetum cinerariifolium]